MAKRCWKKKKNSILIHSLPFHVPHSSSAMITLCSLSLHPHASSLNFSMTPILQGQQVPMADMGYGSGGGIGAPAGGVRLYPSVQVGDLLPQPTTPTPTPLSPSLHPLCFTLSTSFYLTVLSLGLLSGAVSWPDRGRKGSVPTHWLHVVSHRASVSEMAMLRAGAYIHGSGYKEFFLLIKWCLLLLLLIQKSTHMHGHISKHLLSISRLRSSRDKNIKYIVNQ